MKHRTSPSIILAALIFDLALYASLAWMFFGRAY